MPVHTNEVGDKPVAIALADLIQRGKRGPRRVPARLGDSVAKISLRPLRGQTAVIDGSDKRLLVRLNQRIPVGFQIAPLAIAIQIVPNALEPALKFG